MILPIAPMINLVDPLRPGDLVMMTSWESCTLGAMPVEIAKDGTVRGPLAGAPEKYISYLHLGGLTLKQAEQKFLIYCAQTWGPNGAYSLTLVRRRNLIRVTVIGPHGAQEFSDFRLGDRLLAAICRYQPPDFNKVVSFRIVRADGTVTIHSWNAVVNEPIVGGPLLQNGDRIELKSASGNENKRAH